MAVLEVPSRFVGAAGHGGTITSQYLPYLVVGVCLTLVWDRARPYQHLPVQWFSPW